MKYYTIQISYKERSIRSMAAWCQDNNFRYWVAFRGDAMIDFNFHRSEGATLFALRWA